MSSKAQGNRHRPVQLVELSRTKQYYKNQHTADAEVSLALTVEEFQSIAEGKTKIDDAVKAADITLTSSQAKLDEFLSMFTTFNAWYNVVTPVEAK